MSDPKCNNHQVAAAAYADVAIDSSNSSSNGNSPVSTPMPHPRWLVEDTSTSVGNGGDDQATTIDREHPQETRRRKHREAMARLRHDTRTRIQQLETQMHSLQRHLHRLLQLTAHRRPDDFGEDDHRQFRRCRVVEYAALIKETQSLRQAQDSLEELLHRRKKFDRVLHNQSRRIEEDARLDLSGGMIPAYAAAATTAPPLSGYWFQFLETEAPFFYDCESLSTAASLIQQGLERVRNVRHTLASTKVHAVHCLGWQTQRSIVRDQPTARPLLLFRFSRRVPKSRTSLAELQSKTWQLLNSTELTGRLYGSTVVSKVVQRLSDDTIITLRNSPTRMIHLRFRQFSVNTRLHSIDNNKAMVLITSVDKEPRQEQLENEHLAETDKNCEKIVWLKNSSVGLEFSTGPDSEWIEIECGGSVECANDDHANHLLIESCAALLRWEHSVVPPRLLAG